MMQGASDEVSDKMNLCFYEDFLLSLPASTAPHLFTVAS